MKKIKLPDFYLEIKELNFKKGASSLCEHSGIIYVGFFLTHSEAVGEWSKFTVYLRSAFFERKRRLIFEKNEYSFKKNFHVFNFSIKVFKKTKKMNISNPIKILPR